MEKEVDVRWYMCENLSAVGKVSDAECFDVVCKVFKRFSEVFFNF